MEQIKTEQGSYTLFLRQGGVLLPQALPAFIKAARTGAQAIYADERFHLGDGRQEAVLKPDYAPQTLLSFPYVGGPLAVKTDLLERLGTEGGEGPALRLQEAGIYLVHIPEILMESPKPEPFSYENLVEASLKRRRIRALAVEGAFPGGCLLRFGSPAKADVGVIVPFLGDCRTLQQSLAGVERCALGIPFRCYVPYFTPPSDKIQAYFSALEETGRVELLYAPRCANGAALKNTAAQVAEEQLLLFLDAGMEPLGARSLSEGLGWALQPGIGAVGGLMLHADGRIANAGFLLGQGEGLKPILRGRSPKETGLWMDCFCRSVRNASALGGGALLMERDRFLASRGFDETMPEAGVEAEFCVRLMRQGLYNLYHPEFRFLTPNEAARIRPGNQRMLDAFFPFTRTGDPMVARNPLWKPDNIL